MTVKSLCLISKVRNKKEKWEQDLLEWRHIVANVKQKLKPRKVEVSAKVSNKHTHTPPPPPPPTTRPRGVLRLQHEFL